eukprot:3934443-Rhodomonas_salina.2
MERPFDGPTRTDAAHHTAGQYRTLRRCTLGQYRTLQSYTLAQYHTHTHMRTDTLYFSTGHRLAR